MIEALPSTTVRRARQLTGLLGHVNHFATTEVYGRRMQPDTDTLDRMIPTIVADAFVGNAASRRRFVECMRSSFSLRGRYSSRAREQLRFEELAAYDVVVARLSRGRLVFELFLSDELRITTSGRNVTIDMDLERTPRCKLESLRGRPVGEALDVPLLRRDEPVVRTRTDEFRAVIEFRTR